MIISTLYGLVMIAVLVGILRQITEDNLLAPSSLFFIIVAGQLIITGLLHPLEVRKNRSQVECSAKLTFVLGDVFAVRDHLLLHCAQHVHVAHHLLAFQPQQRQLGHQG
jgi:hypothetical protein